MDKSGNRRGSGPWPGPKYTVVPHFGILRGFWDEKINRVKPRNWGDRVKQGTPRYAKRQLLQPITLIVGRRPTRATSSEIRIPQNTRLGIVQQNPNP